MFVTNYKNKTLSEILHLIPTNHLYNRQSRLSTAIKVNNNSEIDHCFLVDRGHPNGKEVHCVTKNGCIFIYNENTLKFITVLIARPNQIFRLYKPLKLPISSHIIKQCENNVKNKLNYI